MAKKMNSICSFCGKGQKDSGPMVEGPSILSKLNMGKKSLSPAIQEAMALLGNQNIFICQECVTTCQEIIRQETNKTQPILDIPSPHELHNSLDEYCIGQERTKKTLAVAVHNHYKRLSLRGISKVEIDKSNVLLIGSTGTGKTLLAKSLARKLNVPFAIADATTLTEAGYVGEDVENILLQLLQSAGDDVLKAQTGIIYIDEIDKIGRTSHNISITRDVSGEGVQQSLLKIIEGKIANVPPGGGRKHPEQKYIQIDTSNILFICGGTFSGLSDIIRRRLGHGVIGFQNENNTNSTIEEEGNLLAQVSPEDLIEFGMIPELTGRLPVLTALHPLGVDELIRILTEPKNALIKQYEAFFQAEGCNLVFQPAALKRIAEKAMERKTGARALRGIMEEIMLDPMYDLPTCSDKSDKIVTVEVVDGKELLIPQQLRRKSA